LDEYWAQWGNAQDTVRPLPGGVSEFSLVSLFSISRSDFAIQRAHHRYEDVFVEFCTYLLQNEEPPWSRSPSSAKVRANYSWAAMMTFVGQRLQALLFQNEVEGLALELIMNGQLPEGCWLVLTKNSARPSVFITAAAIHALALAQPRGWEEAVARAAKWLWSRQSRIGSWREVGWHECYLTTLVLDAIDLAAGRSQFTFVPDLEVNLSVSRRSDTRKASRKRNHRLATSPALVNGSRTPFVPNEFQRSILRALESRALKKQPLAGEVCNGEGSRLYRNGGIKELIAEGKVCHKPRLGYYRPDAPPPSP
jgi:hypothetical protein